MDLKLLIVNYHYIREVLPPRGIYNITPDAFEKQLEAIHHNGFHFISLEDIQIAVREKSAQPLNKKSCLVTFDDGLRESYELGLSILDRKGIPGAFYISSSTIGHGKVLDVHKFHHIQSAMSDDQILSNIPYCFFEKLETVADDVIKNQYIWDNPKTAKVKYLINFLLSSSEREDLVRDLFSRCVSNEKEFAENLYMTREQIKDTARRKSLGSHGVSHLPLAYLSEVEIDREIEESRAALIELTGGDIEAISYPYGGASATSELVFESAKKNGYISGVTMLRGLNSENDILERPLQLKRFDTNDVFGGKSETTYKRIFHD